jgi:hypothetical protein
MGTTSSSTTDEGTLAEKHTHEPAPSCPANTDAPALSLSQTRTRGSRRSAAFHRTRSQNGYGVDEEAHDADDRDEEHDFAAAASQPEKDPFEVGWANGDSDPLCPRSMSKARKWLITIIATNCSFCV